MIVALLTNLHSTSRLKGVVLKLSFSKRHLCSLGIQADIKVIKLILSALYILSINQSASVYEKKILYEIFNINRFFD